MMDHQTLLAEYTRNGSDAAFRELVTRYVDLVFSTALRLVEGDTHRAEDVVQTVFVDLARAARTLPAEVKLGGWLHRDTCFVAATLMRGERRRQARERQAVEMNALQNHSEADFSQVAPLLDEAINELDEADRTAILLRFFEQQDFRAVGQALGSTEDAARMRVTRALEKLEEFLKRRGVTTSAASLGVVLTTNAVQAAPVGLAVTISTAAALAGTTATIATQITMNWFNIKSISAIVVAAIAAGTGTHLLQQREADRLRIENENLAAQQEKLTSERDTALSSANKSTEELDRLRKEKIELLRLRGEVGILRAQTLELEKLRKAVANLDTTNTQNSAAVTAAVGFPKATWTFAGSATPETACQSSFWALSTGDTNALLNLMTPEDKLEAQNKWDSFSMGLSNAPAVFNDTKGFSILGKQVISDNEVVLDVRLDGNITNSFQKTTVKRYGSEWKVLTTKVHEE